MSDGILNEAMASSPGNTPAGERAVRYALTLGVAVADEDKLTAVRALDALVAETELLRQRADKADSRERELIGLYSELVARADTAEAERDEARAALRRLIAACAPPIAALIAVHGDGKYLADGTVKALCDARAELRAALAAVSAPAEPEAGVKT